MAAFMLAIVVESFSSSVMLCSIMNCKGTMSDNVALFSSDRAVVAFFLGLQRFTIYFASVMLLLCSKELSL